MKINEVEVSEKIIDENKLLDEGLVGAMWRIFKRHILRNKDFANLTHKEKMKILRAERDKNPIELKNLDADDVKINPNEPTISNSPLRQDDYTIPKVPNRGGNVISRVSGQPTHTVVRYPRVKKATPGNTTTQKIIKALQSTK